MARKSYIKTVRKLSNFKHFSTTMETLISHALNNKNFVSIALSFEKQNKIVDFFSDDDDEIYQSGLYVLRILKENDFPEDGEVIIYYKDIAEYKKEKTIEILKCIINHKNNEFVNNFKYVQEKYVRQLIDLINEHNERGTNSFFQNTKDKCLELIHEKIKDIPPINQNTGKHKDFIEKRLYSYLINALQILKINNEEIKQFNLRYDKEYLNNAYLSSYSNKIYVIKEFTKNSLIPLFNEIELLHDSFSDEINKIKDDLDFELEIKKQELEWEFDSELKELKKQIEELESKPINDYTNAQNYQESREEYHELNYEYEEMESNQILQIEELEVEMAEEFEVEFIDFTDDFIYKFFNILDSNFQEHYKVSLYHLFSKNKKFKTSAQKYYKVKDNTPKQYKEEQYKIIHLVSYMNELIEDKYHSIFSLSIAKIEFHEKKGFIYNCLEEFENIKAKEDISFIIEQFNKEVHYLSRVQKVNKNINDFTNLYLYHKYKNENGFWMLVVIHFYNQYLELSNQSPITLEDEEKINIISAVFFSTKDKESVDIIHISKILKKHHQN